VRQRNETQRGQSRYLAGAADDEVKDGNYRGALALLRVALPDPAGNNDRPLVDEAVAATYRALYANRERGRLDMPADATAVTTDGQAQTIVIGAPDRLIVRHGLTTADQQILSHQFGAPAHLVLAAGGERLAMIGRDGTVAVRDLRANKELLRHAGEGAGTQAHFIHGADRLLIVSADRSLWRLLDVAGGRELGVRRFPGAETRGVASLVDAPHGLLVMIAGKEARRLSPDDLSDTAAAALELADESALGTSPDGAVIYVATASLLDGKILALDSGTLALQRTFGKLAGGARQLAVSPDAQVIAVHGLVGVDLLNASTGETLRQLPVNRDARRGSFISKTDYMVYGGNGYIRRHSVDSRIGDVAYRTIDGGAIEAVDMLPDRSGFLTISDRPSITNWAFEPLGSTHSYSVPLLALGRDMGIPLPTEAFALTSGKSEVLASYIGHSLRRWNLETGETQLVRQADPKAEAVEHVAAVGSGVVLAEKSGRLKLYNPAQGADRPAAELAGEPLNYLGAFEETKAFAVSKAGAAFLVDFAKAESPRLGPLPMLGTCARQVSIVKVALCIGGDGAIRMLRSGKPQIVNLPARPPAQPAAAFVSLDGNLLAVSWSNGDLEVLSVDDSKIILKRTLAMRLSGNLLRAAAQSPLLTDADREKIQHGATEIEVPTGAGSLVISDDRSHLAVALPDRTLWMIDLATGVSRKIERRQLLRPAEMVFSPNGKQLATVEQGDYNAFYVYDVATGRQLASDSLGYQITPSLARLESGRGFATIDRTGRIVIRPMFEKVEDLMAYLKEHVPEELTPAQRRAFFIE
jgi:WD40 repeat protein